MVNFEVLTLYGSVINPFNIYIHWTTSSYPPDLVNDSYEIYITNETTMQTTIISIPSGLVLSFNFLDQLSPNTTYNLYIISFNSASEASAPSNTITLTTGESYAGIPGGNGGVRPFSMTHGYKDLKNRTRVSHVEYSDLSGSYSVVLVTSSSLTATDPSSATPTTISTNSLYSTNSSIPSSPFYQLYRLDKNRIMSPICSPNNQYGYSNIRKFQ